MEIQDALYQLVEDAKKSQFRFDWVWLACIADEMPYESLEARFARWLAVAQVVPERVPTVVGPREIFYRWNCHSYTIQGVNSSYHRTNELLVLPPARAKPLLPSCIPSWLYEPMCYRTLRTLHGSYRDLWATYASRAMLGTPEVFPIKCPHCGLVQDEMHPAYIGETLPVDYTQCWHCERYFSKVNHAML